jgi:tRNA-specific 2-thiouridylase
MKQKHVGIAMSGGVDSTACALKLKDKFHLTGFFMDLGQPEFSQQVEKLKRLTKQIGIDLHIIDVKESFRNIVLNYFSTSYYAGRTPNPCMVCNHEIKFGMFMQAILATGIELVATGHYARVERDGQEMKLLKGKDEKKDQSYFLSRLKPHQLKQILFPLGCMYKEDTYRYIESKGFTDFRGSESQDICFLAGKSVVSYLEEYHPQYVAPGPIVTPDGEEIGRHQGLHRYTIGQRRGLGLPDQSPWYVARIDAKNNRLIVGKHDDLFSHTVTACSAQWLTTSPPRPGEKFNARIRYSHRGAEAVVQSIGGDTFSLRFSAHQRAIAPGQYVVLYDEDRVIGSGEIFSH